jgi:hypothetical protein
MMMMMMMIMMTMMMTLRSSPDFCPATSSDS